MGDRLLELARRIEARPWNRPGADKLWVLNTMWEHRKFLGEIRRAERVGAP